ncbi:MAG: ribosome-associated toxin RatA of RatAB toxin-antitoxin module [Glaciecola sp.]|jgi:ribosome-associated toxin RatA of RatAB toxin-antitoxin module
MGQSASDKTSIARPAADVMAVITDLESYPVWAEGVTKVEVHERDDQGRAIEATMWIDAKVFQLDYRLRYEHVNETLITWTLVEGNQITQLDGSYGLVERKGMTEVTYALEVDIALPLPGFMKKRGAKAILETGLRGLKAQVEGA